MSIEKPLNVVLCWHMHQPQNRDLFIGDSQKPWVCLHVIKDYIDMVTHIERDPTARAVINFTPLLLEQVDYYAKQIKSRLNNVDSLSDPLLAALASPNLPTNTEQVNFLVTACLRINKPRLIERFSAYSRLADMSAWIKKNPEGSLYLNNQYLIDLLVWYHLASLGETVQHENICVKRLINKAGSFTVHDRRELLGVISEVLGSLIDRYRRLALQQRIELSISPFAHPIMPLLLSGYNTGDIYSNINNPLLTAYPNGLERVHWHLQQGIDVFEHHFGFKPQGFWPTKGCLFTKIISLLDRYNFKWTVSGSNLIKRSVNTEYKDSKNKTDCTNSRKFKREEFYQSYQLDNHNMRCFFRNDELSKLITFTYSDWQADDAVDDFIRKLEKIASGPDITDNSVISIILDDGYALDSYPQNAYYFLDELYQRFSEHPLLKLTTYNECINNTSEVLPTLVADSWIHGAFSTWIGSQEKVHAWDMLCDAKRCFDYAVKNKNLKNKQLQKAHKQLAICESSNWLWCSDNCDQSDTVSEFECLYYLHITTLYHLLNESPPAYLSKVLTNNGHTSLA
jgi:alpha-amylase/alpha-mannosidase (GH57 family)